MTQGITLCPPFQTVQVAETQVGMHYENTPMQYTKNFLVVKMKNFTGKNLIFFLIFAQNIDCGYTLEPPRRGGSNEYPQSIFWSKNKKKKIYPRIPKFFCIKVGFKGVYITRKCFPDGTIKYKKRTNGFRS